jgi:hypothetical protein
MLLRNPTLGNIGTIASDRDLDMVRYFESRVLEISNSVAKLYSEKAASDAANAAKGWPPSYDMNQITRAQALLQDAQNNLTSWQQQYQRDLNSPATQTSMTIASQTYVTPPNSGTTSAQQILARATQVQDTAQAAQARVAAYQSVANQPAPETFTYETSTSSASMQSGNAVPIESDAVDSADTTAQTTPKIPWGLLLSLGLALWS